MRVYTLNQLKYDLFPIFWMGIFVSIVFLWWFYKVWEKAEEFSPERFDMEGPVPNETNTDFRYVLHLYSCM